MDIFKRPNIVNEIKRRKFEWAGHAYRKHDAMIQRVIQDNPKIKRPQCRRLRLRWVDGIKKDLRNVIRENYGNRDWKEIAENKEKRKRICNIARWS